jgi:hypothetical protein
VPNSTICVRSRRAAEDAGADIVSAPFPLPLLAGGITGVSRGLLFGFQREITGGFLDGLRLSGSRLGPQRRFVGRLSSGFLGCLLCGLSGFAGQPGGSALGGPGVASGRRGLPSHLALGEHRVVCHRAVPLQQGLLRGRGGALAIG